MQQKEKYLQQKKPQQSTKKTRNLVNESNEKDSNLRTTMLILRKLAYDKAEEEAKKHSGKENVTQKEIDTKCES